MSFWRRLFVRRVADLVGKKRVFETDSECLDDGPSDIDYLMTLITGIIHEDIVIDDLKGSGNEKQWTVSFRTAGRIWTSNLGPRDYGPIFGLVNQALDYAKAPRRVHVVSTIRGGQDFSVAYASPSDVNDLLALGWRVECALPHFPHILEHQGLRFRGDRPWRLTSRASVLEVVLAEPCMIQEIPCASNETICFDYEGRLVRAIVTREIKIDGQIIPANTEFIREEE